MAKDKKKTRKHVPASAKTVNLEEYRRQKNNTIFKSQQQSKKPTSTYNKNNKKSNPKKTTTTQTTAIRNSTYYYNKRRKTANRKFITTSILFMLVIILAIALFMQLNSVQALSYQEVAIGSIDNSKILEGVVIRSEQLYTSPFLGDITYIIQEGQMVKQGGQIAVVSDTNLANMYEDELKEVNTNLFNIQSNRIEMSSYAPEIATISSDISSIVNTYYKKQYNIGTEDIYEMRKEIEVKINQKGNYYAQDTVVEDISNERVGLTTEIKKNENSITSDVNGIISYKTDGYEQISSEMDYETYKNIINNTSVSTKMSDIATINEPIYRIVTGYTFEIVCFVDTALEYTVNDEYELHVVGENILRAMLTEKVDIEDRTRLVFKVDTNLLEFLSLRKIEFSIGKEAATGLKIPLQSIVEKMIIMIPNSYIFKENGKNGVYVQQGEDTTFVEITTYLTQDDYRGIEQNLETANTVKLKDILVNIETNETFEITELVIVQGVYAINGGYANFKKVNPIVQNDEYAILSMDSNTALQQKDQIISNPKGINENDLVKNFNIQN
ncbi:MAG: hypothetical protein BEN19_01765 [Epulopiscium sp. Nuni2H_MBin003]|nr:MAG: hypothetical protein BEN19_01765 [Epulopiscium sp. Nuni2H_MBin003]